MWNFSKHFREIFFRPNDRYAVIDGLRALAMLWVLNFHSMFGVTKILDRGELTEFMQSFPLAFNILWQGDKAVDVFFIVSGFLIGLFLYRDMKFEGGIRFKRFYSRRLLRIVPVYLFVLGLYFAVGYRTDFPQLITNLLFVSNLLPSHYEVVHVSWTLMIEMQFYFLAPFFVVAFMKSGRPVLVMAFMFLIAFYFRYQALILRPDGWEPEFYEIVFGDVEGRSLWLAIYENIYTRYAPLVLGLFISYHYVFNRDAVVSWFNNNQKLRYLIMLAGLSLVAYTTIDGLHNPLSSYYESFQPLDNLYYYTFNRNFFSLGCAILIFDMMFMPIKHNILSRFLAMRIWYPISQVVFPFYLIHSFLVVVAGIIVFGTTNLDHIHMVSLFEVFGITIIATILTFILAIPIHVFIERPFMEARN